MAVLTSAPKQTNTPQNSATKSELRIALAGNPNCGKTTLFNALTGLRYKVANYPGVTVEKKFGKIQIPGFESLTLVDLPGIYGLSGTSIDEKITTQYLAGELEKEPAPDLIVAIVDSSNIERNLYLVSQLIDLGIPIIIALNMVDLAERQGIKVYTERLTKALDIPVISIIASKGKGIESLSESIGNKLRSPTPSSRSYDWLPKESPFYTEAARVGKLCLEHEGPKDPKVEVLIGSALLSDAQTCSSPGVQASIEKSRASLVASSIDPYTFEATRRYEWINKVIKDSCSFSTSQTETLGHKIDAVLTHKIWGTLSFVLIMGVIFQSIFMWSQLPMDFIDGIVNSIGKFASTVLPDGQLKSLLVDGVIAGVGSVLVFIPQIAVLFFFLGLLEDSGYLARAAFLMDSIMRRVGLQGRSFIPLLSSFACAIPGILSTRTIPSWADRLATILIAPLMSCSARLPVYAVLIAAFIPSHYVAGFLSLQGLTLLAMYLLGIIGAACVAWILKKTILKREPAFFVMEMPPFRAPSVKLVLRDVWDRVTMFLKTAGTVILACSVVLWFLASYPRSNHELGSNQLRSSYAGKIGSLMEPAIKPLGFNWEIGIGLLASFAAREVFVSSLATIYNVANDDDTSSSLIEILKKKDADGSFTTATALSLMVFYVFACQCMSTLAVCRRETGSWRWTGFMFLYMTVLAYFASFVTYYLASHILGA